MKTIAVAVTVKRFATGGRESTPSIGMPGMFDRPIAMETSVVSVSRAARKMRPRKPMKAPVSNSAPMNPATVPSCSSGKDACTPGASSGDKANATESAMNRRTCTGTRLLPNPGITIRHAPIRQNSRKTARSSDALKVLKMRPPEITRRFRARQRRRRGQFRDATGPAGSGTYVRRSCEHMAGHPVLPPRQNGCHPSCVS